MPNEEVERLNTSGNESDSSPDLDQKNDEDYVPSSDPDEEDDVANDHNSADSDEQLDAAVPLQDLTNYSHNDFQEENELLVSRRKRKRRAKVNPADWKKNVNQAARENGEAYMGIKKVNSKFQADIIDLGTSASRS